LEKRAVRVGAARVKNRSDRVCFYVIGLQSNKKSHKEAKSLIADLKSKHGGKLLMWAGGIWVSE
jgi:hypothetical protein